MASSRDLTFTEPLTPELLHGCDGVSHLLCLCSVCLKLRRNRVCLEDRWKEGRRETRGRKGEGECYNGVPDSNYHTSFC